MRHLFPTLAVLGMLGLAVLGCNRSGSSDSMERSEMNPEDAPFQAAFRVPGMS